MNSQEFMNAVNMLEKEKGINRNIIFDAMELALASAYKKHNNSLTNVRVEINRETGEIRLFSFITVVDKPVDENGEEREIDDRIELSLEDAQKIEPSIKVGETIETEVDMKEFSRVATSIAKQVIVQKIREAERNIIVEEYSDKKDEMIVGIVEMEDQDNYIVNLGRTQGLLPKTEIIPGEKIIIGSNIKVYVTRVENDTRGSLILLSRIKPYFVKRLFELEIPEINEGVVLIYSVAREAGVRTKIAVYSETPNVDAIGACIGERGSRIANILKELGNEKVDIVLYDKNPAKFIENALSPAKNLRVFVTDEKKGESIVIVDSDNLSLAIGKKGLNVRLASKLTHFKIDVKTYEQAKDEGINILEG